MSKEDMERTYAGIGPNERRPTEFVIDFEEFDFHFVGNLRDAKGFMDRYYKFKEYLDSGRPCEPKDCMLLLELVCYCMTHGFRRHATPVRKEKLVNE